MAGTDEDTGILSRLHAWRHGSQAAICDSAEPWAYGTVMRASAYPDYWNYNLVRVERPPEMSVGELRAFADEALAGLDHRRVDFDDAELAERYRAGLEAAGWFWTKLVWMRHGGDLPAAEGPAIEVDEVPYEDAHELRVAWHAEDFPGTNVGSFHEQAREVALAMGAQVIVSRDAGRPVSFAQIERVAGSAEITQVYVHPDYRGGGRGTAMTRAAIEAASDAEDLWICADADDRAKDLYRRLGFEPLTCTAELTRRP